MKVTQRIPTGDYAYMEFHELEYDCPQEAIADHNRLVNLVKNDGGGMSDQEFAKHREQAYMEGKWKGSDESWMRMSKFQQAVLQQFRLTADGIKRKSA